MPYTWRTIDDQAERLKIGERTIKTWLANGLKHSKVNGVVRIADEQVDDFLLAHETSRHRVDDIVESCLADLAGQ